jgi:type I restriction enzyme S subunit
MSENKKQLPKDWKWVKLGDTLDIQGGSQPPKSKFIYQPKQGYIQLLQIRDFGEKGVPTYVPIEKVTKFCTKDDIMIARYGASLGRIITGLEGAYNVALAKVIDEKKAFEKRYIFYLLKTQIFQRPLKLLSRSAQNGFSKSELAHILLPLPPKAVQQRVVSKIEELFSELDKGIEALRLAQKQLESYRQSVLKCAFEGKLTNENVKEGELPKGWKWSKLGQLIEKPKYGTSRKCEYDKDGIGVLRIPNIAKGIVDSSDLKFSTFGQSEIETYNLKEGDILTIRSNGSVDLVGKCAIIRKADEGFLFAGYLIRLRPLTNLILPEYLLYILSSIKLRTQIEEKAKSTSGVNNINSEELSSLIILHPSTEEQYDIVQAVENRLSISDKMEESITKCLLQAEALRQSILKKAFEGTLV